MVLCNLSCWLVLGSSSERNAPPAAAAVLPNVSSSCQFDELEKRLHRVTVTPTLPSSGVTSHFQFSPVKSGWSSAPSVGHTKVHSLPSTEFRRDSFPPYVTSALKRSAAAVVPSLARTRTAMPATTLMAQMAASSSVRVPPPTSALQHLPATSTTRLFSPRGAAPPTSKVAPSQARTPVCRTGAGSLLAPSAAAACSGISYSLALSSSLTSTGRPSAGQINTSNVSGGQSLSDPTRVRQFRPTVLLSGNAEHREAQFRENLDRQLELIGKRDASQMYNNFHGTQQRTLGDCSAAAALSHTTLASCHQTGLARYSPYHGLGHVSRPSCAQYRAGVFTSPSASNVSSQQHSLQTPGRFVSLPVMHITSVMTVIVRK